MGLPEPQARPNRNGIEHDVRLVDLRLRLESLGLGESWVTEATIRSQVCDYSYSTWGPAH